MDNSDGGGRKLFRLYYCDTCILFLRFCLLNLYHVHKSRFICWLREISQVSRRIILWIIVLTFATFFNFVLYILIITTLFEVLFISYYSRFLLFESRDMGLSLNCSHGSCRLWSFFLSFYSSLRAISGSTGLVMWKSAWRNVCPLQFVFHLESLVRLSIISYILAGGRSFRSLINVGISLGNPE